MKQRLGEVSFVRYWEREVGYSLGEGIGTERGRGKQDRSGRTKLNREW